MKYLLIVQIEDRVVEFKCDNFYSAQQMLAYYCRRYNIKINTSGTGRSSAYCRNTVTLCEIKECSKIILPFEIMLIEEPYVRNIRDGGAISNIHLYSREYGKKLIVQSDAISGKFYPIKVGDIINYTVAFYINKNEYTHINFLQEYPSFRNEDVKWEFDYINVYYSEEHY